MSAPSVAQVMEDIYTSIHNDNENIDTLIEQLKAAMTAEGKKAAPVNSSRLMQNNRQGRKTMEAYFRKRGVTLEFSKD